MEHNQRLYHLVCVNEKTGAKVFLSAYPMNHESACIMLSKNTQHKGTRKQLQGVSPQHHAEYVSLLKRKGEIDQEREIVEQHNPVTGHHINTDRVYQLRFERNNIARRIEQVMQDE